MRIKLIYIVPLLVLIFTFVSCEDEYSETKEIGFEQASFDKIQIKDADLNKLNFEAINGILHFSTEDDAYEYLKEVSRLSLNELTNFESKNNFKSFRAHYLEELKKLSQIDSYEDYLIFRNKSTRFLIEDENGFYNPNVYGFSLILSADKIVNIAGQYHYYTNHYLLTSDNFEALENNILDVDLNNGLVKYIELPTSSQNVELRSDHSLPCVNFNSSDYWQLESVPGPDYNVATSVFHTVLKGNHKRLGGRWYLEGTIQHCRRFTHPRGGTWSRPFWANLLIEAKTDSFNDWVGGPNNEWTIYGRLNENNFNQYDWFLGSSWNHHSLGDLWTRVGCKM